ncbi:TPA: phage antirepressor KilAC domain-containing protein [Klebsiella pneumoniae]|nr:phage antirepressor KilAC domain-containing protein [Escherichia coli]HBQ1296462.1 phage antirepressor KilAC domain-containing protein [Klebsiella pneumoniae]
MNAITIQNVELPVIEIEGQRVVTLSMVDRVHQRPEGTASRNFREHRPRFIETEDYFEVTADEIRRQSLGHVFPPRTPKGILLTESGYLMLVKSFTDDLAWEVQRKLVNSYFRVKEAVSDLHAALADPAKLRTVLLAYTEKVMALEAKVQEQAPKAQFHDAVAEAINCQSVQEIAKVLGTGPNRLFKFLRDEGLLMRNNLPYQQHLDAGHFRVVEKQYNDGRGESHTYTRTLVTGKGLAYIQRRIQSQSTIMQEAIA